MLFRRRAIVLLSLAVTGWAFALLLLQPALAQRPTAVTGPAPVIPGLSHLGVQANSLGDVSRSAALTEMMHAQQLGAGIIVIQVHWRLIEPTRTVSPTYNFAEYDALFDDAKAQGLVPLVVLWDNPVWAYAGDTTDRKLLNPEGRAGLGQLMKALVQRYGHTKALWSLYSEPDCSGPTLLPDRPADLIPSTCWGNHGGQYTEMLKVVYPAVKEADPNAPVLLGGLAYDFWGTPEQPGDFAERFLDDVLTSGGGAFFDVLNFHYYTEFADKWAPYGKDIIGKTNYLREKLAAHNLDKPIVVSEISKHGAIDSDETTQARYLIQANARALYAGSSANIWYNLRDLPDPGYAFGLLRADGTEKPSGQAYRTLARWSAALNPASAERPVVPAGAEAYEFAAKSGPERFLAAWADAAGQIPVRVYATMVTVTSRTGATQAVRDADDGQSDGYVTLTVTEDPTLASWQATGPTPTATSMPTVSPAATASAIPTASPTQVGSLAVFLPVVIRNQSSDASPRLAFTVFLPAVIRAQTGGW